MKKSAFSKLLAAFVSVFVLCYGPTPAFARRGGGSRGGGGSHGGNSHRGGFHGGGHASYGGRGGFHGGVHSGFGGGNFFRGSHATRPESFAHAGGGYVNGGRMRDGWQTNRGGFPSGLAQNFARNSFLGGRSYGSSVDSRDFGRFGASQPVAHNTFAKTGGWHSFGNAYRPSVSASARFGTSTFGNEWHSFGNMNRGRPEMPRANWSGARSDGQWQSFGGSRDRSVERNASGLWFYRANRPMEWSQREADAGFRWNRFSTHSWEPERFSSYSSFSSGYRTRDLDFGGRHFRNSGFGSSDFANVGLGFGSFADSFASGASLIPNLLFGGLFPLLKPFSGLGGILGATAALSLAQNLLSSGQASSGFGQDNPFLGDFRLGQAGFNGGVGFEQPLLWPSYSVGAISWSPGWAGNGYLLPTPSYSIPFGWGRLGSWRSGSRPY